MAIPQPNGGNVVDPVNPSVLRSTATGLRLLRAAVAPPEQDLARAFIAVLERHVAVRRAFLVFGDMDDGIGPHLVLALVAWDVDPSLLGGLRDVISTHPAAGRFVDVVHIQERRERAYRALATPIFERRPRPHPPPTATRS